MTNSEAQKHQYPYFADSGYINLGPARVIFPSEIQGLRDLFQHERDQALGRWRDPENPNMVVYDHGTSLLVVDETTGRNSWWDRNDYPTSFNSDQPGYATAYAYINTHPEWQVWTTAAIGEAWAITVDGEEYAAVVCYDERDDPRFLLKESELSIHSDRITAGHRIWPEGDDQ